MRLVRSWGADMRRESVGALLVSIVVLAVTKGWAQSGYDPPPPLSPSSSRECDDFQNRLDMRVKDLGKAANDCGEQIYDQCYRSGLSIDDSIRCRDRNQGGNYGENTDCGYVSYVWPRCRPLAYQRQCAISRSYQLVKACRAQVDNYQQNVARQRQMDQQAEQQQNAVRQAEQQRAEQRQQAQQGAMDRLEGRQTAINNVANALTQLLTGMQEKNTSEEPDEGDEGSSSESPADSDRQANIEPQRQHYPQGRGNNPGSPSQPSVDDTVSDLLAPSSTSNSGPSVDDSIENLLAYKRAPEDESSIDAGSGSGGVDASMNDLLASNEVPGNPASDVPGTGQPSVDTPVDKSVQDILGTEDDKKKQNCTALLNYRDTTLEHDFEVALTQRDLYATQKEEEFTLAKETLEIMDKDGWRGWLTGGHEKAVAEVAIRVKFITDEVNAFIAIFNPVESEALDAVNMAGRGVDLAIKVVEHGAERASKEAGKTTAWMLAEEVGKLDRDQVFFYKELKLLDRVGGVAAAEHGVLDYEENMKQLEETKSVIQEDVRRLVNSARNWRDKEKEAQSKADSIYKIKEQISTYCSSGLPPQEQGIPIGQPGNQGIPVEPPK